jgi:hypothetical protein
VVAVAHVLVDAVLDALDTLAALQQRGDPGLDAALPLELAPPSATITLRPANSLVSASSSVRRIASTS